MGTIVTALALVLAACTADGAEPTEGSVTIAVTTRSTGKHYAPRHALAVWITDRSGAFVRTLACRGKNYRRYLRRWTRASANSTVDAVTSASLKRHRQHTFTWDCRDARGNLVPDGDYDIRVEFTEKNGSGPVTPAGYLRFTKGPAPATLAPEDLRYFEGMSIRYTPADPPPATP